VAHLVGLPGGAEDGEDSPASAWLADVLQQVTDDPERRPDLLVVSGDLAARGRKREYAHTLDLLDRMLAALALTRDRVVLLPGEGDVNREACAAYFLACAAEDEEAEPPYWPKWTHFAAMFGRFYPATAADAPPTASFAPGEPWSLIEVPSLRTVVAALNSTMAMTHLDQDRYGLLGEQQLAWFESRLSRYEERGWLRIAALHHDPTDPGSLRDADRLADLLGPRLNLILTGRPSGASLARLPDTTPVLGPANGASGGTGEGAGVAADGVRTGFELVRISGERLVRWTPDGAGSGLVREEFPFAPVRAEVTFPAAPVAPDRQPPGPPVRKPEDFAHRVREICMLRHPGSTVSVIEPAGNAPMYLRVTSIEEGFVTQRPVGLAEHGVDAETLATFVQHVHQNFAAADPYLVSELVYGGDRASDQLVTHGRHRSVHLRSFVEYQGLMDLRGYLVRQTERLNASRLYPPHTYVPQRFRMLGEPADVDPRQDVLEQTLGWLDVDEQQFQLVLGDFGLGKTFLLQEIARRMPERMPHLTPMLLELRTLEKARSVDELVAQHLVGSGEKEINLEAFRYMLRRGRIVLLFDGFDELALRVSYDRAAERLQTLLQALEGKAKIIVSSRSQHFMSTRQILTALGERVDHLAGSRLIELVPFSDEQIRDYLRRVSEDDRSADERMELIYDIKDLLGLSRNPRMLGFIARLDPERLRRVQAQEGTISSADLYRELLEHWFRHEDWRASPRGAAPALTIEDRWRAVTALALRLWRSRERTVAASDLSEETTRALGPLTDRYLDDEQAAQLVGSGTLLVRDEEGRFSFVHQSVMEWLVAAEGARQLAASGQAPPLLGQHPISALMADFFTGLAGREVAQAWAHRVLDSTTTDASKPNALLVLDRLGVQRAMQARLTKQNLRGDVLSDADLRRSDLVGADLTSARLLRVDLREARLRTARLTRAVLDDVLLGDADLTEADFTDARLIRTDLTGADLTGSRWTRARLVDVTADRTAFAGPELAEAAVVGRDRVEVERPPSVAPSRAATFSPDGRLLAYATGHCIVIADCRVGRQLRVLTGHAGPVTSLAFGPDGRTLISGSEDGTVRLWRAQDATLVRSLSHPAPVLAVAVSADGSLLAAATADGGAQLRRTANLDAVEPLTVDSTAVRTLAFSRDGTVLALGDADGHVRVRTLGGGQESRTLRGSARPVNAVAFGPDDGLLAAGGSDGQVRLWRTVDGSLAETLPAHTPTVLGLAFSPDGEHLASCGGDGTARLWSLGDFAEVAQLSGHDDDVAAVAFAPRGDLLATAGSDGMVKVWAVAARTERYTFTGRVEEINDMAASADGTVLATAGDAGNVRLWRPSGTTCTVLPAEGVQGAHGVGFSPDGRLIGVGMANGSVQIRRTSDGAAQPSPVGTPHSGPVRNVRFSPDGRLLATAAAEGQIRLWRVADAVRMNTLASPTRTVAGMAFSPDGRYLVTAGGDETVQFWDMDSGQRREPLLTGRTRVVSAIAFTRSGGLLACGGSDGTVQLWRPAEGRQQGSLDAHQGWVRGVAFSPDGALLASAGQDHVVRVWRISDGSLVATLEGHRGPVDDVAFCPGGLLASSGSDSVLLLWGLKRAALDTTLVPLAGNGWAALHADGRYRLHGEPGDSFWWAIKLCRFGPGEVDAPRDPSVRRLTADPER
jgi:WD40 repeat protein